MKILVIGGSGFLGSEVTRQAAGAGHETVATFATSSGTASDVLWRPLDLRDHRRITELVAEVDPDTVINTSSGNANWEITAEGAIRVGMATARHGCRLVHVSSDAVFSGSPDPYDERCLPDPVTSYGAAKAAAETGVRLLTLDSAVARTSLIIGDGHSAHERFVHDLAAGMRTGVLFTDDIRCPVHVTDLAAALLELAASDVSGVQHLAGPDALSRHDLGALIARRDGLNPSALPSGRRADSPFPGALDVRLDSRTTQQRLRTRLRGAQEFLTAR
ncbi:SDR family oxidoreductase [Streptomyces pinistramenti]|uniref:SDR family oxidoreductase n=1 Tax=Streptomyces pinistramenti TaxID=2884812 RepID=UPI001D093FD0|nr:sugar nucleotide-binding protein [Streptomyces pinistramenti]MCB5905891.1 sugar nucleotide-binding protein [Streptomyces pinistramenti]